MPHLCGVDTGIDDEGASGSRLVAALPAAVLIALSAIVDPVLAGTALTILLGGWIVLAAGGGDDAAERPSPPPAA